jgi:cytochrome c-type biogenesis protein CcmH
VIALAVFLVLIAAAASFAIWPVLRAGRGHALLAAAIAIFVIAIGAGSYLVLGQPGLALRNARGPSAADLGSLVAPMVDHLHKSPNDIRGWTMLGRLYLTIDDPQDGAKALARAITLSRAAKSQSAQPYSAYGEAIVRLSSGAVPPEAEAAFDEALRLNPKDRAARYFLGFAYAARGENAKAIALWQNLLNDAPADASYRQELTDRIAALGAASGRTPDIAAMVAGLAARLKVQPDDPQGWQRLIRAYAVLGNNARALAALREARVGMAKKPQALAALDAEAKALKLEK